MQNFRDYYEILGIAKTADPAEIKRAYRALARKYHPDLNPGDKAAEEKFKLLGEAYDVLSDTEKRQQYEEYSQYWNQKGFKKSWRGTKGRRRASAQEEYSAFEDFDNFVEQLLKRHKEGGRSHKRAAPKAPTREQPAARAPEPEPEPPAPEDDWTTRRASRAPVDNWEEVTSDNASSRSTARTAARERTEQTPISEQSQRRSQVGRQSNRQSSRQSTYARQPLSPSRRDAEADLTVPLEKAYAGGRERISLEDGRSLEVNMPPGMVTGQRIRLKGQGIDGGNLYLRIEVEPHPYFVLDEGDVYCRLPITPSEAVLGGTVAVPTLAGLVNMLIPPGVQTGQRLRLSGKGYLVGPGLYGDQIVELELVVPTVLDDEEKALYQELRSIERFDPRSNLPV